MKALCNLFGLAICLATFKLAAQSDNSYGKMQTRFEKEALEPEDSAAFIQSGMQKARTLFEYNTVYLENSSNASNQKYVKKKMPELFFVTEGDSVDINLVMQKAQAIVQKQTGKPVELKFEKKTGVLGQVSTVDTQPIFKADLVIVKVNKSFGKMSKQVWQVFLAKPVFEE